MGRNVVGRDRGTSRLCHLRQQMLIDSISKFTAQSISIPNLFILISAGGCCCHHLHAASSDSYGPFQALPFQAS